MSVCTSTPAINMKFQIVFLGSILARFETNLEITATYMTKLFSVNLFWGGKLKEVGGSSFGLGKCVL